MQPHPITRRRFCRRCLVVASAGTILSGWPAAGRILAAEGDPLRRPDVPGKLLLRARSGRETAKDSGKYETVVDELQWDVARTAIVICDMWADHPCRMAAVRVDAMAPRMNRVVSAARSLGVQIVHAPSGGVAHYDGTPYRDEPSVPEDNLWLQSALDQD